MVHAERNVFAQALMMEIEKNPVKLAYYDYLALEYYLKNVSDCEKNIKKHISEFTDEQFKQYIKLRLGTIMADQIK